MADTTPKAYPIAGDNTPTTYLCIPVGFIMDLIDADPADIDWSHYDKVFRFALASITGCGQLPLDEREFENLRVATRQWLTITAHPTPANENG